MNKLCNIKSELNMMNKYFFMNESSIFHTKIPFSDSLLIRINIYYLHEIIYKFSIKNKNVLQKMTINYYINKESNNILNENIKLFSGDSELISIYNNFHSLMKKELTRVKRTIKYKIILYSIFKNDNIIENLVKEEIFNDNIIPEENLIAIKNYICELLLSNKNSNINSEYLIENFDKKILKI